MGTRPKIEHVSVCFASRQNKKPKNMTFSGNLNRFHPRRCWSQAGRPGALAASKGAVCLGVGPQLCLRKAGYTGHFHRIHLLSPGLKSDILGENYPRWDLSGNRILTSRPAATSRFIAYLSQSRNSYYTVFGRDLQGVLRIYL